MAKSSMIRMLSGCLFVVWLAAGCASAPAEKSAATHYWESTATTKQYNADHSACEQRTQVDADGKLDPHSTSFEAYRECMIEQGYSLRTY